MERITFTPNLKTEKCCEKLCVVIRCDLLCSEHAYPPVKNLCEWIGDQLFVPSLCTVFLLLLLSFVLYLDKEKRIKRNTDITWRCVCLLVCHDGNLASPYSILFLWFNPQLLSVSAAGGGCGVEDQADLLGVETKRGRSLTLLTMPPFLYQAIHHSPLPTLDQSDWPTGGGSPTGSLGKVLVTIIIIIK